MSPHTRHTATVSAPAKTGWDRVLVLNLAIGLGTVLMFVSYLAISAQSVQDGFTLRDAESRLVSLEERQERLGLQLLQKRTMSQLEDQINELGYVPVGEVEYLQVGGAVAVR